jgi:hypothetical protein
MDGDELACIGEDLPRKRATLIVASTPQVPCDPRSQVVVARRAVTDPRDLGSVFAAHARNRARGEGSELMIWAG